jgi:hypothetical protein
VLPALFRPRATFARIVEHPGDTWLTPITVLMVLSVLEVLIAAPIKQAAQQLGPTLPESAQWWSQEQIAQYMQIQSYATGPVFVYVFPILLNVLTIWVGWLVLVGLLHLALTLLGGRGSTRTAMNVVAWASLPFALRSLVHMLGMWQTQQLLKYAGLSGLVTADGTTLNLILGAGLALVDIYWLWHVLWLIVGVRVSTSLPLGKAVSGVLLSVGVFMALQALPAFLVARYPELQIIRPFF